MGKRKTHVALLVKEKERGLLGVYENFDSYTEIPKSAFLDVLL